MYELMQVGKKTYYINCPAKMEKIFALLIVEMTNMLHLRY